MVCNRCIMAVENVLKSLDIKYLSVTLGEVEVGEEPAAETLSQLDDKLQAIGFEIIEDKKSQLIERIKTEIVYLVHHSGEVLNTNLSVWLSGKLHYDYTYLSNLFSEVEGTTIEKYYIAQRIEKVKELLVYDEFTLLQIADMLGYSSAAYLSGQFKKVTGFTPSHYKDIKENKRRSLDQL
ncbi:Helix-turn-helix domain-containing protein [Flavobacterium akiainvivens]|nr:Helix-turn-helix domain-containing protein [Flavobacterium akiainvivens]